MKRALRTLRALVVSLLLLAGACFGWLLRQSEHERPVVPDPGVELRQADSTAARVSSRVSRPGPRLLDSLIYIPRDPHQRPLVVHTGFALGYDESCEQAAWVAYWLGPERLQDDRDRSQMEFLQDPFVRSGSALPEWYRGSGYDRGHLAPAADMEWSARAFQESFYTSNISPQVQDFNRGIWERCERLVRSWARRERRIHIVTGPILPSASQPPTEKLRGRVCVPTHFYKVVLDYHPPEYKALGFIIPNRALEGSPRRYVVSVDSVERLSGLDFFTQLPDSLEQALECCPSPELWRWQLPFGGYGRMPRRN